MLKIAVKVLIFCFLILIINESLRYFVTTKSNLTTEPEFESKFIEFKKSNPSTLIMGSSRSYTAIDPAIFDSTLAHYGSQKSTYNLGISALFFPRMFHIVNEIFVKLPPKTKTILIELSYNDEFYSNNLKDFLKLNFSESFEKMNIGEFYKFTKTRVFNIFNWPTKMFIKSKVIGKNGFISTNDFNQNSEYEQNLKNKIIDFATNNPNQINGLAFKNYEKIILQNQINDLLKLSKKYALHLVFFKPNRINPQNIALLNQVYKNIPNQNKFDPNQNPSFPLLLKPEYSWDISHLNEKGAIIYSKLFAEEYYRQIIKKGYLK